MDDKELTPELVNNLLQEMNGNLSLSARTLKQCVGYEWVSREYLSKYVNADDRLRALWREARDPLTDLEPIAGKKLELGLANIDEQQRDKLIKHRKERFEAAGKMWKAW